MTDILIILYGSIACAWLSYIAMAIRNISRKIELLYSDCYYHIHKDRL